MIRQIAHICFFTSNTENMIRFYRDTLEFKIKFIMKGKDNNPFGYYFDCGNSTFIELFEQEGAVKEFGGEIMEMRDGSKYRHVCFEVTGLQELKTKLEAKGLEVSPITSGLDYSRQAWIKDPDGNSIEIMEYSASSLQFTGKGE